MQSRKYPRAPMDPCLGLDYRSPSCGINSRFQVIDKWHKMYATQIQGKAKVKSWHLSGLNVHGIIET